MTSTNYNTWDRIIRNAYQDAGYTQTGDDPSPEQFADGQNRLQDLITFEQTQGLKIWQQVDQAIPLQANKATYSLVTGGDVNIAKPMRVLDSGYYLDANGISRTIFMISKGDYMQLGNKAQTGQVSQYLVDKLQNQINVTFWLVPDAVAATGSAHLLIQQPVSQIIKLTDTMNFPQEWFLFLRWMLADDISTGQPESIMQRCSTKCEQYRAAVENWDVEDASTRFTPDTLQSGMRGSRFA